MNVVREPTINSEEIRELSHGANECNEHSSRPHLSRCVEIISDAIERNDNSNKHDDSHKQYIHRGILIKNKENDIRKRENTNESEQAI